MFRFIVPRKTNVFPVDVLRPMCFAQFISKQHSGVRYGSTVRSLALSRAADSTARKAASKWNQSHTKMCLSGSARNDSSQEASGSASSSASAASSTAVSKMRYALTAYLHQKLVVEAERDRRYSTQGVLVGFVPNQDNELYESIKDLADSVEAALSPRLAMAVQMAELLQDFGSPAHLRRFINRRSPEAEASPGKFFTALLFAKAVGERLILRGEPQKVATIVDALVDFFTLQMTLIAIQNMQKTSNKSSQK